MTGRQFALRLLYAFGAALFALIGTLALGWRGAIVGLLIFAVFLKMPNYSDWR